MCVSIPPDITDHLIRGSRGEEREGAGEEEKMTEQGMEMELPREEESGPECGMFTWSGWKSSADIQRGLFQRRVLNFVSLIPND